MNVYQIIKPYRSIDIKKLMNFRWKKLSILIIANKRPICRIFLNGIHFVEMYRKYTRDSVTITVINFDE